MNETQVDANEVIEELLNQLKQANLQLAIARSLINKLNAATSQGDAAPSNLAG
jgi:hypothetical protein